ncbi:hypothetical protein D1815_02470 [Aquimarina sp. AD1]|uniref:hypothetical protein n=1 Tax=Aquimarina sp. (strain AD1) TaxID=1714848 RepID=UPI000E4F05C9|nr:hypothetical protein [Aquimarina sp. AD1]AXT54671.1 hypothetical protein D1815_02470 [Aquimarina sp. AD1]RKN19232.1 hypothetical protein D7035_13970 [Aquimarina sp. AD1]
MKNILTFILIAFLLTSCSNQEKRIILLEKELNIELGKDYKIIQDDDVSHNGFESYYTLKLKIELNKNDLERIVKQLESEPYFDQLGKFRSETGRYRLAGQENIDYFENATDSLKRTKYRGSWFKTNTGFEFMDLGNKMEPIDAEINLKELTLKFEFSHL